MARKIMVLGFCAAALMATAFFSGCATTAQLEEVRALAVQASTRAEIAAAKANEASQKVDECCTDAQRAAEDAKAAAARAEAAAAKSERIFEKVGGK